MTTTLRVIVDDIVSPTPGTVSRYSEELTRELIRTAPAGCEVSGVIASSPESDYATVRTLLPGMADLFKSALARRELQRAWQHGITRLPGKGMVHSPSLLAPLSRHDRVNDPLNQTVVTLHDASPWTHPDLVDPRRASWTKSMAKRAQRYADAIVVPTYSVAGRLKDFIDFGDRVRVIGGAVSTKLHVPVDADERARDLDLPERYVLTVGSLEPRKGLVPLIRSLNTTADAGLPLLIAGLAPGDPELGTIIAEAGVAEERVRALGRLSDVDLSVALDRATVFAYPSLAGGFGLAMLEAFHFGTPVVHSDAPAIVEVAADAGIAVALTDEDSYPGRFAAAIRSVIEDEQLAGRLRFSGIDRAGAFSWRDSAQRVWQLHADL